MKFSQHLACHMTPEWRKMYLKYDEMKALLYSKLEDMPPDEEQEEKKHYLAEFEHIFFDFFSKELERINSFYKERLNEAEVRFRDLKSKLKPEQIGMDARNSLNILSMPISERKRFEIGRGLRESYLALVLLQNYQDLNYTGLCKILKKYDRLFSSNQGNKWIAEVLQDKEIHKEYYLLDGLIRETEDIVTEEFEGGNRSEAMKKLKVPPLERKFGPWEIYSMGIFTGAYVILLAVVIHAILQKVDGVTYDWHMLLRCFRGPIILNFYIFCAGTNIYFWKHYGVNHILIFELDPRNNLEAQHFFQVSGVFSCITAISIFCFLFAKELGLPIFSVPLVLHILYVAFLLNPTRTFCYSARIWLLRKIFRVICAPLYKVKFADFWLADQFASLTPVVLDIQYIACFFINANDIMSREVALSHSCITSCHCNNPQNIIRPLIRLLPEIIRCLQCCRKFCERTSILQLFNALKYSITFFVVIFSAFHAALRVDRPMFGVIVLVDPIFLSWVFFAIVNSFYCYFWDVRMDWGLWSSNAGKNQHLREEIVYGGGKKFYYFGMIEDFFLRFSWAFSLSLSEMQYIHGDILVTIMAPIEIFRRFIWNFFRLENEHLNNCEDYRTIRDLSILPKFHRRGVENSFVDDSISVVDFSDGMNLLVLKHSKTSFNSTPISGQSSLLFHQKTNAGSETEYNNVRSRRILNESSNV